MVPIRNDLKETLIQDMKSRGLETSMFKFRSIFDKNDNKQLNRFKPVFVSELHIRSSESMMAHNFGNSEKDQAMANECPFSLLFRKNVEHILEDIFTSIDYATLRRCLIVCREWNTYLKSDSFLQAAKSAFSFNMWTDVNQTKIITLSHAPKKLTTNGKEVVYVSSDWKHLFYITSDGTRKSLYLGDLPIDPIRFTNTT